jgi:hypothetical protein
MAVTPEGRRRAGESDAPGSSDVVDTSYAFRRWYEANKEKITSLTKVSEANASTLRALQFAFESGMTFERQAQRSARYAASGASVNVSSATGRISEPPWDANASGRTRRVERIRPTTEQI